MAFYVLQDGAGLVSMALLECNEGDTRHVRQYAHLREGPRSEMERSVMRMPFYTAAIKGGSGEPAQGLLRANTRTGTTVMSAPATHYQAFDAFVS